MSIARLTSKGQVTIPKEVRDQMGLRAGDEIEFVETEHGFRVEKDSTNLRFAPFTRDPRYFRTYFPELVLT